MSTTDDTVVTPGGPRHSSLVHLVPDGGRLHHADNQIHLIDHKGTILSKADLPSAPITSTPAAMGQGWITFSGWWNNTGSPISSFTTTWRVPPAPSTDNDQTIFLFNGIQPGNSRGILQPVLQWGASAAGGGSYWTVASWYVTSGHAYHSTLVNVNVGDELDGKMVLDSHSGSNYNYTSSFTNIANTSLKVTNNPELKWACETLEVYSVTKASDYPATDTTLMKNINIKTDNGKTPALTWQVNNRVTDCGQHTVIAVDGASDGMVELIYRSGLTWHQTDLTKETSAPAATGMPACFTWSHDNTMHVFYCGKDNDIHELWYNGSWHHNNLRTIAKGPAAISNPGAYAWSEDSSMHVVYRGTDNHIHEYWYKDLKWNHNDLTSASSAPLADSSPVGYVWECDSSMQVIYRGTDSHVHKLSYKSGVNWTHKDLTTATGVWSVVTGTPSGYNFDDDDTQHVIFRGSDGNIYELWCVYKSSETDKESWGHKDISSEAGAPKCAWNTWGYGRWSDSTQHVVYRGLDKQVHELWWKQKWHHTNVSEAAGGAPPAASDPSAYIWDIDSSQHIVYGDSGGRVHELCFKNSGWTYNDLVGSAAATRLATAQPVGFFRATESLHVVYCDSDGHLQELYRYY